MMRTLSRRLALGGVAALFAGSTLAVVTTTPAAATNWGCSGSEVSDSPYAVKTDSGAVYSYAHLYYDSSTGKNCAVNVKVGSLYGTRTTTTVTLGECEQTAPGPCNMLQEQYDPADDVSEYSYYAGPVTVTGKGHCIYLAAQTDDTAHTHAFYNSFYGFHCG